MATLLLVIIYLAFISLGLPDSLLGAAWPAAHTGLGVSVSMAGFVSAVTTVGTVLSSLVSTKLIKRFGTGTVTAGCVILTAVALFLISITDSFVFLCLLALPLGLGGGSIDAALNNFVAMHYKATHMNFLHAFWGVGATMSPLIMAAFLAKNGDWHGGYRAVAFVQAGLAVVMLLTLPMWRKSNGQADAATPEAELITDNRVALQVPGAKTGMLALFFYCAAEMTAGLWGATYFTTVRGVPPDVAARWGSLFFMGIMAGRFLSGALAVKLSEKALIRCGLVVAALGAVTLLLPLPDLLQLAGFLLIGFGCAPVFPNTIRMSPARFGPALSQAVVGLMMASSYVGSTVMPPVFGLVGQRLGFQYMPYFILACFLLLLLLTEANNRRFEKQRIP